MKIVFLLIIFLFLWGIYFLVQRPVRQVESFMNGNCQTTLGKCPTTLIKDGQHYYMYDPSMAKVPGVNPIPFKDLNEYKEYIEWQRRNQLQCPILHLERVCNAQGSQIYEIRQNFIDQEECGLQPQQISSVYVPKEAKQCGGNNQDTLSLALT